MPLGWLEFRQGLGQGARVLGGALGGPWVARSCGQADRGRGMGEQGRGGAFGKTDGMGTGREAPARVGRHLLTTAGRSRAAETLRGGPCPSSWERTGGPPGNNGSCLRSTAGAPWRSSRPYPLCWDQHGHL